MNPLDPEPKDIFEDRRANVPQEIPDEELATKKPPPPKNKFIFFVWLAVFATVAALFWGYSGFLIDFAKVTTENKPFLQVSNREMSVFLWQFPNLLRQNVGSRTDYLPGFELENRVGVRHGYEDTRVSAPPEVLFLYHTWDRLIRGEFIERSIPKSEFYEFLTQNPEWLPENWKAAPADYAGMVRSLDSVPSQDLRTALPLDVRMAFQGWRNFVSEGEFINAHVITFGELKEFLGKSPHYARNYWINILRKDYPDYLKTYTSGTFKDSDSVPSKELAPFLKVALFNMLQADKGI